MLYTPLVQFIHGVVIVCLVWCLLGQRLPLSIPLQENRFLEIPWQKVRMLEMTIPPCNGGCLFKGTPQNDGFPFDFFFKPPKRDTFKKNRPE